MHPQHNIRRRLASLTVPIFIEILLIMLLSASDTFMLSQCSDSAVAAVGVDSQLLNMIFLVFNVSTVGTAALCAQFFGAGQPDNLARVVGISLLCNTLAGAAVSLVLYFQAAWVLGLMDLRPELMPDAVIYMRIVGGFAFVQALVSTLSAVLRSENLARYPMLVILLVNVVNIAGNYALIFGHWGFPALGVEGAAIATSASRGLALGLLVFILWRKGWPPMRWALFRPFPWDKLRNLLSIGLPSAGEHLSYSLSQVVITFFINILGIQALAARTYAMNIIMFTFLFSLALAQGGAICIAQLIGQGQRQAAYVLGRYCLRLSIIISLCMAVVSAVAGRLVMPFLTNDAAVIHLVGLVLLVDIALELGRAVNIAMCGILAAAGDATYPFVVGVVVMWGVATAFGYVFGITLGFGLVGMWVAFTLDENIRAWLLARRWESRVWERYQFVK